MSAEPEYTDVILKDVYEMEEAIKNGTATII